MGYEGDERRSCYKDEKTCPHASEAAESAVRKVFAILGVDVDNPEKVEEFRKSLRWSDDMRKRAGHGWMVAVSVIVAALVAYLMQGFGHK